MDEDLLAAAKQLAARTGKTLNSVIQDAVREAVMLQPKHKKGARIRLPTDKGRGLQSGVDLDDSATLLDLMERG